MSEDSVCVVLPIIAGYIKTVFQAVDPCKSYIYITTPYFILIRPISVNNFTQLSLSLNAIRLASTGVFSIDQGQLATFQPSSIRSYQRDCFPRRYSSP